MVLEWNSLVKNGTSAQSVFSNVFFLFSSSERDIKTMLVPLCKHQTCLPQESTFSFLPPTTHTHTSLTDLTPFLLKSCFTARWGFFPVGKRWRKNKIFQDWTEKWVFRALSFLLLVFSSVFFTNDFGICTSVFQLEPWLCIKIIPTLTVDSNSFLVTLVALKPNNLSLVWVPGHVYTHLGWG